jgi:hypothetical protein
MARDGRKTFYALLALAAGGLLITLAILAWFGGAGRSTDNRPIVEEVPPATRKEQLDRGAERTKGARDAARRELEQLQKGR